MTPEPEGQLAIAPVAREQRISSVDMIRGLALLGILLMNIVDFALPHWAYDDPSVAGGASGLNLATWAINYILFEGKMRALFSMLFGAGVILITSRAEERGAGANMADIFYRRNLWLLAFGLVHAYFIWAGDILYFYSVTALLFLYPLRKLSPKRLILIAAIILAILVPRRILEGWEIVSQRDEAAAANAAQTAGKKLTDEQKTAQTRWADRMKEFKPPPEQLKKDIDQMRRGYLGPLTRRGGIVPMIESTYYYRWGVFDTAGAMILGMGLLKLGFFSAKRRYREYAVVAAMGYAIGLPVNIYVASTLVKTQWDPTTFAFAFVAYDLERIVVALAHASVLMIIAKAGVLQWLTSRLAAVGQMALTNYLTHSIVCSTIFYGYGFGLFGRLDRYQIYYVVAALWVFQLVMSKIWLSYFRFGPVEWVWRSLTYWQRQPMRIEQPVAAPENALAAEA